MNASLLPRTDILEDTVLPRVLRLWLGGGVLVCLVLPTSSWNNAFVGWLPFWLVVSPALCLCLLHRRWMAAALSAFLVRGSRRRPSATHRRHAPTKWTSVRSVTQDIDSSRLRRRV